MIATTRRTKRKLPAGVVVKNGRWYVRVRYRGDDGKRHAVWRECAQNATDAKDVRNKILREVEDHGAESLVHAGDTFADLADLYEEKYLVPARYVDGEKVAGRRNLRNPKSQLKRLRAIISPTMKLREMGYEFLKAVRLTLFDTPTRNSKAEPAGHQRSMIDVNRHMELLRHMLKVAGPGRLAWIHHDPFAQKKQEPLITPAGEKKRRRVMSFTEEAALLDHCRGKRAHLRLLIIGLADTLMRSESEFFKLRVGDLDLDTRRINVQQMNTKTLRARAAPISSRFAEEARRRIEEKGLGAQDRLFPYDSVKTSWATLKRTAGVTDLRIKDLRRTAATRLLRRGHPIAEISQLLGHTSIAMTYEYIGIDTETTGRAVDVLDAMHAEVALLEAAESVN